MIKLRRRREPPSTPGFENASGVISSNGPEDIHFASYFNDQRGNYGDRILPWLAIDLIDYFIPIPPTYRLLHIKCGSNPTVAHKLKSRPRAMIIGPGGLICGRDKRETNDNFKWFANFSSDDAFRLREAGTKIFFWGTGVNRWSNKRLLDDDALKELELIFQCVDKAFIRGRADIEFLKGFLPIKVHENLLFQPCPSFFIPEIRNVKRRCDPRRRVAINVAADQLDEYFSLPQEIINNREKHKTLYYRKFATHLRPLLETIRADGMTPVFFCSTREDVFFAKSLFPDIERLETNTIAADFIQLEQLLSTFEFAVGMRLHAWLPFISLGIPSLFLTPFEMRASMPNDLGLARLSCHIKAEKIPDWDLKFREMVANQKNINDNICSIKKDMFQLSGNNVAFIRESLSLD